MASVHQKQPVPNVAVSVLIPEKFSPAVTAVDKSVFILLFEFSTCVQEKSAITGTKIPDRIKCIFCFIFIGFVPFLAGNKRCSRNSKTVFNR
jgi:hypothetical protein